MGASSIRKFWQLLQGTVHPVDQPILNLYPDVFDLQFPPPAFIGDIDNAPVVILLGNGGYDPLTTPSEFPSQSDHDEHIDWLKSERLDPPKNLAAYYTNKKLFPLVKEGKVVYVNAVAYRKKKITQTVRSLAKRLPSTDVHKKWMWDELFPSAARRERLVIAHRYALWDLDSKAKAPVANLHFSKCPASEHLDGESQFAIDAFLRK